MNAPTGNYPGSVVRDYYRKKEYEDSTEKKSSNSANFERRLIISQFKGKTGRTPTTNEIKAIEKMSGSRGDKIRKFLDQQGKGWSANKDGNMVPPSETTQPLITPAQHQTLGELYKQVNVPTQKMDLGNSKFANIIENIGLMGGAIKKANLKNKIKQIEEPGSFIPDEDPGYQDSAPSTYWENSKSKVSPVTVQSQSVAPQTMDMAQVNQGGQPNTMGLQLSDDPIIRMQQDLLNYGAQLKKPYVEWGNEAMGELKGLLDEGSLTPDGSPIENFQFQDLKDDFKLKQYDKQRPEITQFEPGQAPEMYQTGRAEASGQYEDYKPRDAYSRPEFQDSSQFRDVAGRPERPEYETFRPQDSFVRGEAPQSPEAEYYNPYGGKRPQDVYQAENFNIKDDPGYQLARSEAMRGVEASGAARGQQLSGATLKALQDRATGLASQQANDAYARYVDQRDFAAQQEREGYGRGERYEDRMTDATRYRSQDQYGRYRDDVGDYRDDRNFQYGQHRDERGDRWQEHVYDDTMKDQRYNRDMDVYKDDRNFAYGKYRDERGDRWDQYQYGTQFDRGTEQDNYARGRDAYLTNRDNYRYTDESKRRAEQENYERMKNLYGDKTDAYRYDTNLRYGANQDYQNRMQGAYSEDKGDFYNLQDQKWKQGLGNIALQDENQNRRYGQLQDVYNMNLGQTGTQYNRLKDIIGMGLNAQNASIGQQGNYSNFLTDWNVNQTNRQDALNQAKSDKRWNLANFLLNTLG